MNLIKHSLLMTMPDPLIITSKKIILKLIIVMNYHRLMTITRHKLLTTANEVIPTNQNMLPGLEQPNQQVLRFEETPLQTFNTSTKYFQNPDIKSDVNQKTTSSQNDLQSNYLAEMPFHPTVKDCYKSDGKMSFDGQWSCAEHNCTVAGYIACSPKVQRNYS